jgi:hypothetical protein
MYTYIYIHTFIHVYKRIEQHIQTYLHRTKPEIDWTLFNFGYWMIALIILNSEPRFRIFIPAVRWISNHLGRTIAMGNPHKSMEVLMGIRSKSGGFSMEHGLFFHFFFGSKWNVCGTLGHSFLVINHLCRIEEIASGYDPGQKTS